MFPNSAPDSFTPKSWNLVLALGQAEEDGAELVVEGGVVVGGADVGGAVVGVPGMHWK